jgi:hypothetical protein
VHADAGYKQRRGRSLARVVCSRRQQQGRQTPEIHRRARRMLLGLPTVLARGRVRVRLRAPRGSACTIPRATFGYSHGSNNATPVDEMIGEGSRRARNSWVAVLAVVGRLYGSGSICNDTRWYRLCPRVLERMSFDFAWFDFNFACERSTQGSRRYDSTRTVSLTSIRNLKERWL